MNKNIVRGFTADGIARKIGIKDPLEGIKVIEVIEEYVENGYLKRVYFILCPRCFNQITCISQQELNKRDVQKKEESKYCIRCKEEIPYENVEYQIKYKINKP